jgi:LacI family transcriptional regulator, galactose operon repressor
MRHSRRRRARGGRSPGIREIADAVGVSIGTVDRALHDRAGINRSTRARILETARRIGYRPNLAARFLSSRKELRIAVCLPREIASFWKEVRDGIEQAARPFAAAGVRIEARSYSRLGIGESEALEACLEGEFHGLVIAPGRPERLAPLIGRAHAAGIPVVCVNTDAPGTARLTSVAVDPVTSGALVGELMGRFVKREGPVVVVTGLLSTIDHAEKLAAFRKTVGDMWPGLEVADVVEAHDDEGKAYSTCRTVLARRRRVAGVYVSTANSLPVLRAIEDEGLAQQITVIATDLFPALVPLIEGGRVAATIHQRPFTQGRLAFEVLYRFLVEGLPPQSSFRLSPHVVLRSNLGPFLEALRSPSREAEPGTTSRAGAGALALAGLE